MSTAMDGRRVCDEAHELRLRLSGLVRQIREKRGMTQGQAAALAGMTQAQWSIAERGGTLEKLMALLGAMGYRLDVRIVPLTQGAK